MLWGRGGVRGYGGYGGYRRRVRVWDFDLNQGRLETWKRVEGGEGVVGGGRGRVCLWRGGWCLSCEEGGVGCQR